MELHDLGKNCSMSVCKQLDFLPFSCSYCGHVYCLEHRHPNKHNCVAIDESLIDQPLPCTNLYYKCAFDCCSASSSCPLLCMVCQKHYCIAHRHHGCLDKPPSEEEIKRWNKPKEEFTLAKNEVEKEISNKLKDQVDKKGSSTARKLQVMKLKGRAIGTRGIPIPNRLYFLVFTPLQYVTDPLAVYINKDWSIGRVIDSVADLGKITNNNNVATAPKLRLFKHSNGELLGPISKIFQLTIDEGIIFDGDMLILEYVPGKNVCNDSVVNTTFYK